MSLYGSGLRHNGEESHDSGIFPECSSSIRAIANITATMESRELIPTTSYARSRGTKVHVVENQPIPTTLLRDQVNNISTFRKQLLISV